MAQATQSLSPNQDVPILVIPGIARSLARHFAINALKEHLRAQGVRVTHVPYADINAQAAEYLRQRPALFDQAMEIVRSHPWYCAWAEKEERERQRQWRKLGVTDLTKLTTKV